MKEGLGLGKNPDVINIKKVKHEFLLWLSGLNIWSFLYSGAAVAPQINPQPGNFHRPWMQPKRKK